MSACPKVHHMTLLLIGRPSACTRPSNKVSGHLKRMGVKGDVVFTPVFEP